MSLASRRSGENIADWAERVEKALFDLRFDQEESASITKFLHWFEMRRGIAFLKLKNVKSEDNFAKKLEVITDSPPKAIVKFQAQPFACSHVEIMRKDEQEAPETFWNLLKGKLTQEEFNGIASNKLWQAGEKTDAEDYQERLTYRIPVLILLNMDLNNNTINLIWDCMRMRSMCRTIILSGISAQSFMNEFQKAKHRTFPWMSKALRIMEDSKRQEIIKNTLSECPLIDF